MMYISDTILTVLEVAEIFLSVNKSLHRIYVTDSQP
jgi:hypothetical protein